MISIDVALSTTAENRDRFVAALVDMGKKCQSEPGCITYRFTGDLEDPNKFYLTELWESMDALQVHFKVPHMGPFFAAVTELGKFEGSTARSGDLQEFELKF